LGVGLSRVSVRGWVWGWVVGVGVGVGAGVVEGEVEGEEEGAVEAEGTAEDAAMVDGGMQAATRSHYGDPDLGCRADEDTLLAGTGRVCAPRIAIGAPPIPIGAAASVEEERLPVPQCKLGGVHRDAHNGCPMDHRATARGAWPVCLAKGNVTDPYSAGSFHCLLVCPCKKGGNDCGKASHAHCPGASRCERGELRNRAQGVCTYHGEHA